jgi:hypothetical protein
MVYSFDIVFLHLFVESKIAENRKTFAKGEIELWHIPELEQIWPKIKRF